MRTIANKWVLLIITAVLTGLPLWVINYHTYTNHRLYSYISLFIVAVLAVVYPFTTTFKVVRIFKILLGGFLLALIIKIFIDTQEDPTNHNLFPFELLLGGIAASFAALLGLAVSLLIKYMAKKKGTSF